MPSMRAHLVQMNIEWENRDANYRKVEAMLDSADVRESDLVVLPELFDSGFSLNTATTKDKDGATLRFLLDLADDVGEFATLFEAGGMARVEHEMQLDTNGEESEKSFFRLWTPSGELLFATDLVAFPGLQPPSEERLAAAARSQEQLVGLFELAERDAPIRRAVGTISSGLVLEIGESTEDDEEFVAALAQGFQK